MVATGGGAVVDPRNRWALFRGRTSVWLDGRPEVLAQRLRRSPNVRPLDQRPRPDRDDPRPRGAARAVLRRGHDPPDRGDRGPRRRRRRRPAHRRAPRRGSLDERRTRSPDDAAPRDHADRPDRARRGDRRVGAWRSELEALRAPRAILVSEPGRVGCRRASGWRPSCGDRGRDVAHILLPQGEAGQAARRRRDGGPRAGGDARRARRRRWSRSVAVHSATRPGSSPRSTCAASGSSRCRRRSSPRSTPRSAARPASTCPRARTSSGRSTSRPRS